MIVCPHWRQSFVARKVDLIFVSGSSGTVAARDATSTIPIVSPGAATWSRPALSQASPVPAAT
jgi:hypothetical protein